MNEIQKAFSEMTKGQTYTGLAEISGISRSTIWNVRNDPDRATLGVLKRIMEALGYRLVIKLEKVQ